MRNIKFGSNQSTSVCGPLSMCATSDLGEVHQQLVLTIRLLPEDGLKQQGHKRASPSLLAFRDCCAGSPCEGDTPWSHLVTDSPISRHEQMAEKTWLPVDQAA